ncbi:MAG: hypothetical protein IJ019_01920 [Alphaproteobacteria bacterium]|nr:hypothetical protein [Alphaproteobacteria bacterium]
MKNKCLKYVITVAGTMFWSSYAYSFGFPTFDIAEVAGTIKGVTTSNMSLVSTGTSTAATGQMLVEKGDGISSMLKFKDDAAEQAKKAAKNAKKAKARAEKAAKRAKKLEELKQFAADAKDVVNTAVMVGVAAQTTYNMISDEVEEYNSSKENENQQETSSNATQSVPIAKDTIRQGEVNSSTVKNMNNNSVAVSSGRTFKSQSLDVEKVVVEKQNQVVKIDEVNELQRVMKSQPNNVESQSKSLSDTVREVGQIKNNVPNVQEKQSAVKEISDTKLSDKVKNAVDNTNNASKMPVNARPIRTFKSVAKASPDKEANNEYNYRFSSKVSYAQAGFASGMTDDGTFVYSDIIADKCGLDFKDAGDEDKVEECIKTWVLCMNQEDAELSLACRKEYQKAMHDQVAADLASSINDKKYATTFDDEVAADLENKSAATTTEREEGSFSAAVSRANQEVLLRMMNAMSSQLLQGSLLAIDQIDPSYYEEE